MGRTDLASALTTDCHTSLCFYGHPDGTIQYNTLHCLWGHMCHTTQELDMWKAL